MSEGITIKLHLDQPGREYDFGLPAQAVLTYRLCEECGEGIMMPTGSVARSPQGQLFIHACTSEGCEHMESLPMPYPQPDFSPLVDPSHPEILKTVSDAIDAAPPAEVKPKIEIVKG